MMSRSPYINNNNNKKPIKHVALLFFSLLVSEIAKAGADGHFIFLSDELKTSRKLSKNSKSLKQSKSNKSSKSAKTTKGSNSKVSSKSSKSKVSAKDDIYYSVITTKSWSYKVPKGKTPVATTDQHAVKDPRQSVKSSKTSQSFKSSKSQAKASKAKSSKSRSGWSYPTTKSPKSKVASKDSKSAKSKQSKVSKSKSNKSTKSSSNISNDEKQSKSTKSTKSSSNVSNDEQQPSSKKRSKSTKSSPKGTSSSSKSTKSHSKSPKDSSKSAKSPKSSNSYSSSSKSHKNTKAPKQTPPPSKSPPTTLTPIQDEDTKSPTGSIDPTLAPTQSPTGGNTQMQTNLNLEQEPQFILQCQESTNNDIAIRFEVGYDVDIDPNIFAVNSQHTTSRVLLILLNNLESAILSHLSLSSGCPLRQMQLRRAAIRRLALVGIVFLDNRQILANSCTSTTTTTSTTCNVKAINEMEITIDSKEDNTTVCTILEEIKKFFSSYKAGNVDYVQGMTFTGSNYNEQSCSLINKSEQGGIDDTTRAGGKSLFVGWMIAIPLLVFLAIIFCINFIRSRAQADSEVAAGEVDEEHYNLKENHHHHGEGDTDSDASTAQDPHRGYHSPVDVQKCLSGNCMSCSDCDLKKDNKRVKWIKV